MRRIVLAVVALLAASPAAAASVQRGAELIERHCGACHAIGRQDSSHNPAAPPFRELHRRYEPEALSEALGEGLLTGHPLMPEFRFAPDDVTSIILYLKSIQTRQTGDRNIGLREGG